MVVFTCNHCGESLQKPRVEKHYNIQCRRAKSLTCVDCFKDFKDEEYVVHTKCITEEERYAAKGSIQGTIVKKGEVKQESWTDMIKSIVDSAESLKPSLRNLFHTISNYTNVPRKKNKFINFLKNSLGNRVNFNDVEVAWDLIEKYKNDHSKSENGSTEVISQHEPENSTNKHKHNGTNDEVPAKKKKTKVIEDGKDLNNGIEVEKSVKKKKSKDKEAEKIQDTINNESSAEVNVKIEDIEADIFSFKNTITNILTKKGNIGKEKLQKKVLNAYVKNTGNECTEKTIKKYNKKLKKISNVVISDDIVSLQTPES